MQLTSNAIIIEGNLDSIENPVVAEAYHFARNIFTLQREALRKLPFVEEVPAPTQEEIETEYNSFDLFSTEETPVSRFRDAIERKLASTGYSQDEGVPGISIYTVKSTEDVGPSSYSVNKATITVTFSQERLQEFRKWLVDCNNNLALYHLDNQAAD